MVSKRKNPAAVALGRERWKNLSAAERSEAGRAAVTNRWGEATEEEKLAAGQRLAAARAAARKRREKNGN